MRRLFDHISSSSAAITVGVYHHDSVLIRATTATTKRRRIRIRLISDHLRLDRLCDSLQLWCVYENDVLVHRRWWRQD